MLHRASSSLLSFCGIALAFVLCYGLTTKIITPIQAIFLPEVTVFASLVFLPHGVRILSTMYFGWRALLPLMVGHWASGYLFGPGGVPDIPSLSALASLLIGAASGFVAFEIFRLLGKDYYYRGPKQTTHWKQIILVGIIASFINSLGQVMVYRDHLEVDEYVRTTTVYALGDVIGLFVTMLGLMLLFRWIRFAQKVL